MLSFIRCVVFLTSVKPLKVVNRKHPVREDWNSFALQSEQEDEPLTVEDEDTCIKVRDGLFLHLGSKQEFQLCEEPFENRNNCQSPLRPF